MIAIEEIPVGRAGEFWKIQIDGALYYALNYAKEDSHRFWLSNGFVDNGEDEYGSKLMIKK